jgi:hypothetical protein
MRTLLFAFLAVAMPACGAQQSTPDSQSATSNSPDTQKKQEVVVVSGVATRAHIADPNEPVVFSGRVMRMADFVAAVSSSTEAVRHLRNQEKHSRETTPPAPPSKQQN